ncbi:MAG: BolA family transcriptional regulator [Betaproteobacteria bacterium]|jgi:BolA protein|uniref:BolA family protein n=1 Tax=Thiomonas sp. FB-6 TaxID=1158291 RepID=UPI00037C23DC|nr:BolA family transcriptional regulator [Thiomonas sp. FB-6]MBU6439162.1 BolA family transcriptional regulator [Betaproteobacteria bacterium]MBU6511256.1 BolA family transcriptional regulator [Betaproteobacteria bacterium]MDE1956921.1 BolA family transcriptional regulator [Betaproteobacteria bacterium]MDE2151054.1 BolA family transcriptional regulator [Betaproteobacteria bacterium]MDE2478537.1 BolA family transcriptional regulator [Betaproteobacteria bacterium]
MTRQQRIEQALREAFPGDEAQVEDLSAQHHGHAGFDSLGSHFRLRIRSARFAGLAPLARHRLVYDALDPLLRQEVHSVTLDLRAP